MRRTLVVLFNTALLPAVLPAAALAATAPELAGMLERGEKVTVLDIRSQAEYRESHVPGAIHIPGALLPARDLPPIGKVVVCGDGFGDEPLRAALAALNAKPGIRAEPLEGGFAAWVALHRSDTRPGGMTVERFRYLSFAELEQTSAGNPDVVLLDMRRRDEPPRGRGGGRSAGGGSPVTGSGQGAGRTPTDLAEKFPRAKSLQLARTRAPGQGEVDVPVAVLSDHGGRTLYVLIDDGDGEAEKVAHRLRAAGITRLAILTGGELAVSRGGQAGLETSGSEKK